MNRNALKIPAILMCVTFVILLCCACGSRDQSGYEEREISLPEGCDNIWDFNVADDGVMRIAVTEEEKQKPRRVLGAELVLYGRHAYHGA